MTKIKYICKSYDLLLCETDMIVRLVIDGNEVQFPKSQIVLYKCAKEIEIPEWLFDQKLGYQCVYSQLNVADTVSHMISRRKRGVM